MIKLKLPEHYNYKKNVRAKVLEKKREMSNLKQRHYDKQVELCSNNRPVENNWAGGGMKGMSATTEILKEIRDFRMDTSVNLLTLNK